MNTNRHVLGFASVFCAFLFCAQAAAGQATQLPANSSIEGVVLHATTRAPIEDAQLSLSPKTDNMFRVKPLVTVSSADGTFSFRGLKADAYTLEIVANGYVLHNYGEKTPRGQGAPIEVLAGQTVKGITIAMTPTGTVSGRVEDTVTRRPVAGAPVRLVRSRFEYDGQRRVEEVASATTNDRGEYRLFHLTPGKYYLSAGGMPPRDRDDGLFPIEDANEVPVIYGTRYYPGVADTGQATVIDLKPGADLASHDLQVSAQGLYRIRGRVLDATSGQPFQTPIVGVSLYRRMDNQWVFIRNPETNYRRVDGSFELRDLEPGAYTIATTVFPGGQSPTGNGPLRWATTLTPVEIASVDVEKLVISVSPGVTVNGKIRVDGQSTMPTGSDRIALFSPTGLLASFGRVRAAPANGEVSFDIGNVAPGEYRVVASSLPEGYYLKEANITGFDALHSAARIPDQEKIALELVISPKVAALKVSVTTDRQDPAPGSEVVLIPERERGRWELAQSERSDGDGKFTFSNLAPGEYRVFAWEALEPFTYFDPEVLKQAEARSKVIRLTESSTQDVTLTMIPARN